MDSAQTRFWGLYSHTYDAINFSIPYVAHLDALIDAADVQPGHAVVDLGCATGNLERRLAARGVRDLSITGVDLSPQMLARASRKCRRWPGVSFERADLDSPLPFESGSVDRVICNNVLYAVGDPERLIGEIDRVLRPQGRLVASDPKPDSHIPHVIRAHFDAIAAMPWWRRPWQYLKTGVTLPLGGIPPIVLSTLVIDRRVARGGYHFRSIPEAAALLSPFSGATVASVYAGQSWLGVATKEP